MKSHGFSFSRISASAVTLNIQSSNHNKKSHCVDKNRVVFEAFFRTLYRMFKTERVLIILLVVIVLENFLIYALNVPSQGM